MAGKKDFNLAIISDLHLSSGRCPRTKRFSRNEDFFCDEKFDRFLGHLEREAQERGRKWKLVIAGDMVDFLQVTCKPPDRMFNLRPSEEIYGLGTSPGKTLWKMKVVMEGHWIFFQALGRFISKGNNCTIITGNHDIEWNDPEVQEQFREEMKKYLPRGSQKRIVSSRLEFCPWFYYEPGLIWVEHGHQYDGINSFDYFLYPYLPKSREMMLPGGSFFVRYLFNKVEQRDPFADNIKPVSAYLKRHALRLLLSPRILHHLIYFWKIMRKIGKFPPEDVLPLKRENEKRVAEEAGRFRVSPEGAKQIKEMWIPCFLYNTGRWGNFCRFFTYSADRTFRSIGSVISRELKVRYVVFGHTHEADLWPLSKGGGAEYVNTATWTPIFSENPGERLIKEEQESVFVQVLKDEGDRLELLKWKDELGRGQRVSLFD